MDRLFSFVLPAYKAHFLKEAIDSILAQTYTNWELIIVNDDSPEGLDAIVESYDDYRIQYYVNKENIGGKDLVAQWNHCLKFAKGDYLILASDDDTYHSDYLKKMDELIQKYPTCNLFRPRTQRIDARGTIIGIDGFLPEWTSPLEFAYFMNSVGRGLQFYVFKRSKLESLGGFANYPMAWHSDDATIIQMANKGCVFINEILFSFRLSGESISTKKNDSITLRSKILASQKYYNILPSMLYGLKEYNLLDGWYRDAIINDIDRAHRSIIISCMDSSTKKALFIALPQIIHIKLFSLIDLLIIYIRRLLGN